MRKEINILKMNKTNPERDHTQAQGVCSKVDIQPWVRGGLSVRSSSSSTTDHRQQITGARII